MHSLTIRAERRLQTLNRLAGLRRARGPAA